MTPLQKFEAIYEAFSNDDEIDAARQLVEGAYWMERRDVSVDDVISIGKLAGRLQELETELHSHGWLRLDVPSDAESAVRRAYSSRIRALITQIHREWDDGMDCPEHLR